MGQPVLLAVDADREILATLERDLPRRFAADYRTVTADLPDAALAALNPGDQVAVVMAGQWLTDTLLRRREATSASATRTSWACAP